MMVRRPPAIGALLTVIALATAPLPALAQGDAQAEFDAAQKLFDAGRQADALPHFRKAYEASKSPNARFMAARCLIAMGRAAEAYEEMAATTREATARAETEKKYAVTRDSAAAELALLERRVGKIIVALAEPGPSVVVTLNGARVAPDRVGVPMAVEPGKLVIEAARPAGAPVRREITVAAGETKTVAISFAAAAGAPLGAVTPPAPRAPPQVVEKGGGVRIAGFVVAGLGVAGLGAFAGAGLAAKGKFSTLETECGAARCVDPKYADVIDSGKTLQTVANIGLGAGVAGVVSGALMIALGGPKKQAITASLGGDRGGARLDLQGSF